MPDEKLPLIPHTGSGLVHIGSQGGRVVAEMVNETLSFSRAEAALVPRFKIGEQMFCEPDYRQILLWAKALEMEPAEVMRRLLVKRDSLRRFFSLSFNLRSVMKEHGLPHDAQVFKDGRINQLYWDFELLPLKRFEWVDGLVVEAITFTRPSEKSGPRELNLSVPLPNLRSLICTGMGLAKLDLSMVPKLTALACDSNRLVALDLSTIPRLTSLSCRYNELTELDLSSVPRLTSLICSCNELTELDLSNAPQLITLYCSHNKLTELNLSGVSSLTNLSCEANKLTELDLSDLLCLTKLDCTENEITNLVLANTLPLTELSCDYNQLTKLDLANATQLRSLCCDHNQLIKLDLANATQLRSLSCDYNQLIKLDLSNTTQLRSLSCDYNQLIKLDLSNVTQLRSLSCDHNKLTELDVTCLVNYPFFGLIEVGDNNSLITGYDEDNTIHFRSTGPNMETSPFYLDYDEDKTRLIKRPDQNW